VTRVTQLHLLPRTRLRGDVTPLPTTPSRRGALPLFVYILSVLQITIYVIEIINLHAFVNVLYISLFLHFFC
jgi:hypothetical protein